MRPLLTAVSAVTAALLLTGCCSSGRPVRLHTLSTQTTGPALIVYHPDHATWDTLAMRATILVDGAPVGALCEDQVLVVPLTPGAHVLATSRDDEAGCSMSPRRPADGWPPLTVLVEDGPLFVRYGADPYDGPDTDATICARHLVVVDGATARRDAPRPELVSP